MKFLFDLKYAFRLLLKNAGFTALTISVMAAGLGISFYMFSFIDHTLMRPLPFNNGDRMVVMDQRVDGVMYNGGNLSMHDYRDLKEGTSSFSMMGAYYVGTANLSSSDRAVRYEGVFTEPLFFEFVGVQPLMGRVVTTADDVPGAPLVAVISHELWQSYFNGVADVLGQKIKINGEVTEVIGVMPEKFVFPLANQLWMPMRQDVNQLERGAGINVEVFALLKPDATIESANVEIDTVMQRNEELYPKSNSGVGAYATTYQKYFMGNGTDMIIGIMLIAVAFVLTLACANVGNLLLARANERGKETAIRAALGAPKGRLIMQMMWESLIISCVGGLVALLLAGWGLELSNKLLPTFMPGGRSPFWWVASLDAPVIRAAVIITALTALGTGLFPAWKMASGDFNAVLRDGTRGAQGKKAGRMSRLLVIFEVGLSTALLIIAGVLVVLVGQATNADYGTRIDGVLTTRVGLPTTSYPEADQRVRYYQQLVRDLAAIPGVDSAASTSSLPGRGAGYGNFEPEGYEVVDNKYPRTGRVVVSETFFSALDIPILEGRQFDSSDKQDGLKTAIISDSLARRYWPDGKVLGKRLRMLADGDEPVWLTIVGVIPHIIHGQPYSNVKNRPAIYVPLAQNSRRFMNLLVTTNADPDNLRQQMVDTVARLDPEIPTYQMISLRDRMIRNTAGMNFIKVLFFIFALCALLLASTGIYGVLANSITQRTQEIGVRRALGSSDERVMSMLMRQGWFQLAVGLVFGIPLAYAMSMGFVQLLAPQNAAYNWIFLLVPLLITAVVSLATFIPARRAIRLEPSVALHYE